MTKVELYRKTKKTEIPVATSLDIAETFGKEHFIVLRDIKDTIQSLKSSLQNCMLLGDVGNTGLDVPKPRDMFIKSEYKAANGKMNPMYYLNRDGFTLLVMGYTGQKAMQFKLAYIAQFNAMEKALKEKQKARIKGIDGRKLLTDEIKNQGLTDTAYPAYTNLVYNHVFGMTAAELKHKRGLSKNDNLRDVLTPEELKAIDSVERLVSSLVGLGWQYIRIDKFLNAEGK